MNLTNAQAFFGLRANATPSKPNVRNTNEIGVPATGQALFDAVGAYSLRARLMNTDSFQLIALEGNAFASFSNVPSVIVVSGITNPVGKQDLHLAVNGTADGKIRYGETPSEQVVFYDDDRWRIFVEGDGLDYRAEKISAADSPIGLTDWNVLEGSGQPTIAARENSIAELSGTFTGLDLYGEDLPTMTDIIGVMIQCTNGALQVASTNGNEINEITAGETRMFVNPNGTGAEYVSFDVIAEANDTELEITIIGK